jgi:NitT/TauT family transport system substrate-binding protein
MEDHMSKRTRWIATVATAVLAMMPPIVAAQGAGTPIKIAAYNNVASAPVWVAQELGYFKAEGLDVTLVLTDGGSVISAAMLSGSVDAGTTGIERPLLLQAKGVGTKNLVGTKMGQIYALVGQPDLKVPSGSRQQIMASLKSKRIGIISLGSSADAFAQALFREAGLQPDSDVVRVPVGTGSGLVAALQNKAVDVAFVLEPDLGEILRSGVGKLVLDLRRPDQGGSWSRFPVTTLQVTDKWLAANPDSAAKLVRAVSRANKVLRDDRPAALAVLLKLYPNLRPAAVESIWEAEHNDFTSAITQAQYEMVSTIALQAGMVKQAAPYDAVVATQFSPLWK